jgi:hypothetical protein
MIVVIHPNQGVVSGGSYTNLTLSKFFNDTVGKNSFEVYFGTEKVLDKRLISLNLTVKVPPSVTGATSVTVYILYDGIYYSSGVLTFDYKNFFALTGITPS